MARLREIKKSYGYKRREWPEVLSEFLVHKRLEDGVGEQTIADYTRTVELLFKRFPDAWESDAALKNAVMTHFSDDIKPATFNNRLVYLRAFFKYCVSESLLAVNPLENVKKRKTSDRAVAVETEVLQALLAAPDQRTFVGLRDYTLILLTLDTGIRPSEATKLVPQDFVLSLKEIRVPAEIAKDRNTRTLPLSDMTVKAMRKLISVRDEEWKENVPIFCSYEGRPLNRHTWADRMEIYCKKIGTKIRPYDLRHVFALEFLRNGANSFAVQRSLGHSTMEMTRRYVALVNNDLKAEHAKASPVDRILSKPKAKRNIKL
ncbi:tyrosine-type recombinase/integrase [Paenibacillus xylanivorans]|uniref:Integrase n=1 Tax=Paenibacillus xylanivorans TaxID=1705561 RepID=A0A0M9BIH1_9BACL|nr:tyrosine-type recombinase/integrase [Paenibacillus xylanivorans]KOY12589.1 integrase [Paenibacillus xylanivorans]